MDVKTVRILIVFKMYRTTKLNDLSFDDNHLIKNPICFANFSAPYDCTEMVLYSKFLYRSQFSGEKNYFKIRYLAATIFTK